MSTHEIAASLEFIMSKLTGDATLMSIATGGVYRGMAKVGATPPFIVVAFQAGHDVLTFNDVRMVSQLLFQVRAVGPASLTSAIFQAAARVDDLLKKTSGTATNSLILGLYREEPLHYDENVDGVLWTNTGGLYRPIVQQI
jgi:hypothetical protein